ncbi:NtaA/DmoA family FMN-dependent monooxygenase [Agromyces sp. SYSU T00194]|uniref:NtaA/DmoA family FMN-dependent monooxygenase n=1 Tax=Agromyces chitinivorans TaxID=3158560 RepID=UPI003393EEAD
MVKKMHLGWFMNFSRSTAWTSPWVLESEAREWMNGDYHIDWVRSMERAGFDFAMLEDSSMVADGYGGSMEVDLKHSLYAPKGDPLSIAPVLAKATEHIGIISTASTSFYPPFLLARAIATIDHISQGRAGWNIVTSSEDRAAQNFNLDKLYEHDTRYEMADEFVEVVEKLWSSWDADAVVMDRATGTYVDHTKVRPIDHVGQYYKVRGPLNVPRPPQGRPVYCQAGGSPRGRQFAAAHADTIISAAQGIDDMREFRDDIRRRMIDLGRDPDSCKVMFITTPVLGNTEAEAQERWEAMLHPTQAGVDVALGHMGALTEIDFTQIDADKPFPELTTNGHRTTLEKFLKLGKTPREAAGKWAIRYTDPTFVGTPEKVAAEMSRVFDEVGGDGFLIAAGGSRRGITEITDGLVGALQQLGRTRTSYNHAHLRDNLMEF